MPGIQRYSIDKIGGIINKASKLKIPLVSIFPHTPDNKKNSIGSEALNENNLVCKAIRKIKKNKPRHGSDDRRSIRSIYKSWSRWNF